MAYTKDYIIDFNPNGSTVKVGIEYCDNNIDDLVTNLNAHEALTTNAHGVGTWAIVGEGLTQGLYNKTLHSATISGGTITGAITGTGATITGGTISGATITGGSGVNQTITDPTITGTVTASGATITGATIAGATITGATIAGGTIAGGTSVNQTIQAPTLTGLVTASGATIQSPTLTGATITNSTIGSSNTFPTSSESTAGIAEIATQTEVDTGTDDARIVTPAKLTGAKVINRWLWEYPYQTSRVHVGTSRPTSPLHGDAFWHTSNYTYEVYNAYLQKWINVPWQDIIVHFPEYTASNYMRISSGKMQISSNEGSNWYDVIPLLGARHYSVNGTTSDYKYFLRVGNSLDNTQGSGYRVHIPAVFTTGFTDVPMAHRLVTYVACTGADAYLAPSGATTTTHHAGSYWSNIGTSGASYPARNGLLVHRDAGYGSFGTADIRAWNGGTYVTALLLLYYTNGSYHFSNPHSAAYVAASTHYWLGTVSHGSYTPNVYWAHTTRIG